MKLLVKYATRKRPAKFLTAMDNLLTTIDSPDFKIIVSIDSDDSEMIAIANTRAFKNTTFYINSPEGKIAAINANVPLSGWDWLVNFSDDMKFIVKGWDLKMIENVKRIWPDTTDWFANFNDGYQGAKLPTMSIMGREYYERFFYIYAPCYKSLSCDAEAMYVAMSLHRYHYFPDLYFRHEHPANTKAVKSDNVYAVNEQYAKSDAAIYFQRMARNFCVNGADTSSYERFKRNVR
jgi:hypothetical protein